MVLGVSAIKSPISRALVTETEIDDAFLFGGPSTFLFLHTNVATGLLTQVPARNQSWKGLLSNPTMHNQGCDRHMYDASFKVARYKL